MQQPATLIVATLVLLLAATPAPAYMVSMDEYDLAYSITNLDIGDTRYDVDFNCDQDFFEHTCTLDSRRDLFLGDPEGATAAVEAINAALTEVGATGVHNGIQALYGDSFYTVPFSETQALQGCRFFFCAPAGNYWTYEEVEFYMPGPHRSLAAFTVSTVVPIPAAAWLFGGALIALGALKRRPATVIPPVSRTG